MNTHNETFAAWVTRHREKARYSIRELSREVGVSHSYISKIEGTPASPAEMKPRPSQEIVTNIAKSVGGNVSEALALAGWRSDYPANPQPRPTSEPVFDSPVMAAFNNLSPADQTFFLRMMEERAKMREEGTKELTQQDDGKDYDEE